ncbi:MAG: hypothetical protein OMM_10991, partial [Candidatus Magnetoglobus multicellularis str. Araruama]
DYQNWQTAFDDRGNETNSDIHHVTVRNLSLNTQYLYEIISGNIIDNNDNKFYRITTGPELRDINRFCQPGGKVFKGSIDNDLPIQAIVYIRILGETENSALESMLSNQYWYRDLANFRTEDYSALYPYECGKSMIRIDVEGGKYGIASMETKAVHYQSIEDERTSLVLESNAFCFGLNDLIRMLKVLSGFDNDDSQLYHNKVDIAEIIKSFNKFIYK